MQDAMYIYLALVELCLHNCSNSAELKQLHPLLLLLLKLLLLIPLLQLQLLCTITTATNTIGTNTMATKTTACWGPKIGPLWTGDGKNRIDDCDCTEILESSGLMKKWPFFVGN